MRLEERGKFIAIPLAPALWIEPEQASDGGGLHRAQLRMLNCREAVHRLESRAKLAETVRR
jgi:hypothetical protein